MVIIVSAISGCTGSTNTGTPTTQASNIANTGTSTTTGSGDKISVSQTADKITITGGKGKKMTSDKFQLSNDDWYLVKITYTGADVSDFISSIVTQKMIDADEATGGELTLWMGPNTATEIMHKGFYNTDDYMVYIDQSDGQWTIEMDKSPAPSPVSSDTKFSGTGNTVTPFFHLSQGSATFTMDQPVPTGTFNAGLEATLYNADTGELVAYLTHGDYDAQTTDTEDIPADGNYIISTASSGSWDISYTQ